MATNVVHLLKLVFLLFFSCLWTRHAAEWIYVTPAQAYNSSVGDTLKPGDTLNSSSFLVSAKGTFALGFFRRIDSTSNESYVGISDMADPSMAFNLYVWFGNRGNPIVKHSGMLTLDNNGTLKIVLQGEDPIVIYTSPTINTVGTLLDTGNFVLKEVDLNGSMKRVLWQSFDYPVDTLLPGMRLGVNHKTGHTWSMRSFLTTDIPDQGSFALEWDPKGLELIVKQRGVAYWKSGILIDNQFENISPDITSMYDFHIVSNEDEEYFYFSNKNQSLMSEWLLTFMGQFKDLRGPDIGGADNCYGYYTNGGCQGWEQPVCRHRGETFELKSGHYVTRHSLATYNSSLSISDCKALCWSDCSCVAFSSQFGNDTGCRFWTGESDFASAKSSDFVSINVLSSKPSHRDAGKKKWIWIVTVIAIALLVIFLCALCYLRRRKKVVLKGNNGSKDEKELLDLVISDKSINVNEIPNDAKKGHDVTVFNYKYIMAATNNFSLESKLGEGGFGPVYMGKLLTGQQIAVKRLSRNSGQGTNEFKNELILISKLQHTNLVKLLGCCIFGEERMLIYEYMPNKSLDYFLFDSNRSKLLDWKKRFNIIEGIAQGLIYLHKYSRLKVIHRDLKASNILLDESMNPKISDFGMARIFKQNELEANTNRIVGTYGYMSPEYAMEGVFSIKSDVYSFGVLMLEIVSGRRNNSFYHAEHVLNLVGYAWDLWQEGKGLKLVDPAISDSCVEYQVIRCIHVSLLCVEDGAVDRPTMSDMLSMLTNESIQLPLPKKPAFSIGRKATEANIPNRESGVHTVNGLSISDMDAR